MKIIFATQLHDSSQGKSLSNVGGNSRLLSYHYSNRIESDELAEYVSKGKNVNQINGNKNKNPKSDLPDTFIKFCDLIF